MSTNPVCPLLEVSNVTLQYRAKNSIVTATRKVSFSVEERDRFVMLGQSGCGKSTLLKAIGGFIRPVAGEIRLDGKLIERPGPDRVMVFQEFDQLLSWKTVKENVAFPLREARGLSRKEADERALLYLEKVKLTKFSETYPHMLSGGMKQRVAIARGMAMQPKVLLMDEPFAALDAMTRLHMQDELMQLWDEAKPTIIFVTHSIDEAIRISNRILVLSAHPGQVRAEINCTGDADEVYAHELSERIRAMLFNNNRTDGGNVLGNAHA